MNNCLLYYYFPAVLLLDSNYYHVTLKHNSNRQLTKRVCITIKNTAASGKSCGSKNNYWTPKIPDRKARKQGMPMASETPKLYGYTFTRLNMPTKHISTWKCQNYVLNIDTSRTSNVDFDGCSAYLQDNQNRVCICWTKQIVSCNIFNKYYSGVKISGESWNKTSILHGLKGWNN